MVYIVMACIVMVCTVMACILMACIVMACIAIAYVVMPCIAIAHIVMTCMVIACSNGNMDPQVNIPNPLAWPKLHNNTWAPFWPGKLGGEGSGGEEDDVAGAEMSLEEAEVAAKAIVSAYWD